MYLALRLPHHRPVPQAVGPSARARGRTRCCRRQSAETTVGSALFMDRRVSAQPTPLYQCS